MLPMASVRLGLDVLDDLETRTRQRCFLNHAVFTDCFRWIWAENFGAPIVVNDSLLQSYTGQLRLAPVKLRGAARFGTLRTAGAFLVSGEIDAAGQVRYFAITSEAGAPCSLVRPWAGPVRIRAFPSLLKVMTNEGDGVLSFPTEKGAVYVVDRPSRPWEEQPVVQVSAPPAQPQIPEWFRIQVPGVWPVGWHLIGRGSGQFVSTSSGAVMHCDGPSGSTSGWQMPTVPVDTSRYGRLDIVMQGVGNGKLRLTATGGNGGEVIASQEWTPWPSTTSRLSLELPPLCTVVAVLIFTTTNDGRPVESRISSVKFASTDEPPLDLDLHHITP
jgi:hypothetical protein